jgi:hypothetical protein
MQGATGRTGTGTGTGTGSTVCIDMHIALLLEGFVWVVTQIRHYCVCSRNVRGKKYRPPMHRVCTTNLSIYSSIHPSIQSSIYVHPFIHLSIHSSIHSCIHPSIHSSIHPSSHPYTYIHPSILTSIIACVRAVSTHTASIPDGTCRSTVRTR